MKVGLVLEGGAMRGMFTAGVLDVFLDEQLEFDGAVTVSAGALFGVNLPSKQRGRVLRYNKKYMNDKRFLSLKSWLTTGNLINRDFAFYELPTIHDPFDQATFAQSQMDFWVTLTNVETGEPEYFKVQDVFKEMELFRATSAMPFVSQFVEINGKKYLDGGIADSIPLQKCLDLGYDKIVLVLTRPLEYRKKPSSMALFKWIYRGYPHLIERWQQRYQDYNQTVERIIQLNQAQQIFVIRPSRTIPLSRLEKDPNKLQQMYDLGVADAQQSITALREYLAA
ncbi:patatin-like phospholipase family protein [Actinobacillus equuli]|uniref:patatin-like phospholipase family protein n=1 Tax=Actinobacillus equuli TaxID=718 RepID=UPI00244214D0|nr:patatin family protein [Actinobacillus equuli]WGE52547.1 patatin family protein [Actinobacillus equuli subsp. haemolyticus]WGE72989.1 patatin family protein [Actinobacillus equuli subsp. haemolyticus]